MRSQYGRLVAPTRAPTAQKFKATIVMTKKEARGLVKSYRTVFQAPGTPTYKAVLVLGLVAVWIVAAGCAALGLCLAIKGSF